jgi:hypothetical protein
MDERTGLLSGGGSRALSPMARAGRGRGSTSGGDDEDDVDDAVDVEAGDADRDRDRRTVITVIDGHSPTSVGGGGGGGGGGISHADAFRTIVLAPGTMTNSLLRTHQVGRLELQAEEWCSCRGCAGTVQGKLRQRTLVGTNMMTGLPPLMRTNMRTAMFVTATVSPYWVSRVCDGVCDGVCM